MQSWVQPEAMEVNTAVQIIALNSSCEQAGTNNKYIYYYRRQWQSSLCMIVQAPAESITMWFGLSSPSAEMKWCQDCLENSGFTVQSREGEKECEIYSGTFLFLQFRELSELSQGLKDPYSTAGIWFWYQKRLVWVLVQKAQFPSPPPSEARTTSRMILAMGP